MGRFFHDFILKGVKPYIGTGFCGEGGEAEIPEHANETLEPEASIYLMDG